MNPRLRLIENGRAGTARLRRHLARVRRVLSDHGCSIDYHLPASKNETQSLVAASSRERCDVLVLSGGDGTLNHAVQSFLAIPHDARPPLAVMPSGRGNDFAHEIGIHDLESATRAILHGTDRAIDVGATSTGYFLGIAGTGFDALAARRAQKIRLLSGRSLYAYAVARTLVSYEPVGLRVIGDGRLLYSGPVTLIAAGNTRRYGGGMFITPEATIDDGKLDVCIAESMPLTTLISLFPRLFRASRIEHRAVHYFRVARLEVTSDDTRPIELFGDGEYLETLPTTISVLEKELVVRIPS